MVLLWTTFLLNITSPSMISNYKEALDFIYAKLPMFQRQGTVAYKKDLTNTIKLCAMVGNPQDDIKSIHIAGTNGKGTTTHIIAAGLQAQGYKVGVYTSPHYKDFRERIKINGKYIPSQYITQFIKKHHVQIEEIQPSFFEVTVAMAFAYFRDQKVDFAVIETGLGGRLDSTNIITPLLSVITNISYDHQNLLGDTLEAIAGEKAGIIKQGIPVVIGETQEEIKHVFLQKAQNTHSEITFADDEITVIPKIGVNGIIHFDIYKNNKLWKSHVTTSLSGPFQSRNLVTALFSLIKLSQSIKINWDKIWEFLPTMTQSTKYLGRWQILQNNPMILADSAHNEGGLRVVLEELKTLKYSKIHFVLGFVNDKDLSKILQLFPKDGKYYWAKADIHRGLDANLLKEMGSNHALMGNSYVSVRKALAAAKLSAKEEDFIYVGGSIFVVAEVI
jgi:dihydrofolate synthase / folylpolyglutamate synthase